MGKLEAAGRGPARWGMSTALGLVIGLGASLAGVPHAAAQGAVETVTDEILITATKRGDTIAQDAPIAVTAYGSEQLDALNFQSLQSLSYSMPNVQLEDIGTAANVANFSIRGLGINSSIPSVDPTVGVFVDGVYLGINAGVLTDNFDLEAVEVLRGPQGVLFGRNVTGGAVLIRTRAPSDEFEFTARGAVETGLNYIADMSLSGPLTEDISAKFAYYYNNDEGWFENLHDNSEFGGSTTNIARGALSISPTDVFDIIVRYEYGEYEGDGPAAQNHALFSRDSFDFSINNRGYGTGVWETATLEANWDVGFGDGTITDVVGWRDYDGRSSGDIDSTSSTPGALAFVGGTQFHSRAVNLQNQFSNELRYAGTFGPMDLTAGHYFFEQELLYVEERFLFGGLLPAAPPTPASPLQYAAAAPFWINRVGGGQGTFSTQGVFANADWHLNEQVTLNFGVRYTEEEKQARVSRIRRGVTPVSQPIIAGLGPAGALVGLSILPADNLDGALTPPGDGVVGGSIDNESLAFSDSPFDLSWNDTSPRIGIQWEPTADTNLYAFWAKGFRSGGVNFRVTTLGTASVAQPPTAFDSEEQTSFEIGWKQDFADGRARVNIAVFQNEIEGMQRETNVPSGTSGVQQVIVNAGDATIEGAELEARFSATDNLLFTMQAGYTDGQYDGVTADLNADGLVNDADAALEIPRLSPWTYGLGVIFDIPLGESGVLSNRVGYNHRDANFYTDNNRGTLNEVDYVDADFSFHPNDGGWSFSLYGNNLLDEATFGGDTQLPDSATFGGDGAGPKPPPTFSPLNKGRVIGVELRFRS